MGDVVAGPGDDSITSGERDNVIDGGAGDDTIRLRGTGRNTVRAGAGNDVVHAEAPSRDTISCGTGHDVVYARAGDHVAHDCERVLR